MIAALRSRHRALWFFLALMLPLLVWLALGARPERPVNGEIPSGVERFADDGRAGGNP